MAQSWFSKILTYLDPKPDNYFGMGPFKPLANDHPFQRAAFIHDWEFDRSHVGEQPKPLAEVDSDLFWRLCLLARAERDPHTQCQLMLDICKYWPIARAMGRFAWSGKE